ncbi:phosphoesterase [Secundilactobacillus pentosiphilus]|uniref:Phosphoesterase n=1 Tax=Secundilactobacillus pentosiphilus TaxID=1714682 RepID=A0A1Z5IZM1_9LACO|nr:metallophosphoesterase [Secundilactobacillus pentosiphilus]GAX07225.1 phosphoesterase [Secundilactobacillus pentosiphilus]
MVKVAMVSDLHLDINKVDIEQTLEQQSLWLKENQIGIYLIAGDLFNHFNRSLSFTERLQKMTPNTLVRFIAGNHDMVNDISYDGLQNGISNTYLHRKQLDVSGTDWRIIGNNGWYDYTFSAVLHRPEADFWHWKQAYWIDSAIEQPMSDPERMTQELQAIERQLRQAQQDKKRVLFMTHFVPRIEYLRITSDNRFWNMANAMLGSTRTGQLLTRYHVRYALFGHMHIHPKPRKLAGTVYFNQAVGYGTARRHEWLTDTFESEWLKRIRVIDLTDKKN